MKLYYSSSKKSFFSSLNTFDLPEDIVEISKEEHFLLMNPQSGKALSWDSGNPELVDIVESEKDKVLSKIKILESEVTQRRLRDAILSDEGKSWLIDIENQIEVLRGKL